MSVFLRPRKRFLVRLERESVDEPWGVVLEGPAVSIADEPRPGSVAAHWNSRNRGEQLRAGDIVLKVNGIDLASASGGGKGAGLGRELSKPGLTLDVLAQRPTASAPERDVASQTESRHLVNFQDAEVQAAGKIIADSHSAFTATYEIDNEDVRSLNDVAVVDNVSLAKAGLKRGVSADTQPSVEQERARSTVDLARAAVSAAEEVTKQVQAENDELRSRLRLADAVSRHVTELEAEANRLRKSLKQVETSAEAELQKLREQLRLSERVAERRRYIVEVPAEEAPLKPFYSRGADDHRQLRQHVHGHEPSGQSVGEQIHAASPRQLGRSAWEVPAQFSNTAATFQMTLRQMYGATPHLEETLPPPGAIRAHETLRLSNARQKPHKMNASSSHLALPETGADQFRLREPEFLTVSLDGRVGRTYRLLHGERSSNMPVWKAEHGEIRIFDHAGRWIVGDKNGTENAAFQTYGSLMSKEEHQGRMPDELGQGGWLIFEEEDWQDAHGVKIESSS